MHGADAVEVLRGIHYTRFLPLKTCIDDQSHTTSTDGSSHGTHVAGTIAAIGGNSTGVVGVNPGSRLSLHIVKVFGDSGTWAYSSDLATALNKCRENGSNVVSMSLGGASRSPPSHTTTRRKGRDKRWAGLCVPHHERPGVQSGHSAAGTNTSGSSILARHRSTHSHGWQSPIYCRSYGGPTMREAVVIPAVAFGF